MDPAIYARAFGVQSEANKVTVTRVACNEISYRRVVNTYRKDMNSTVNNIKREQKKLRRCMRGYRKKLHGTAKKEKKPYKFGWIANTHPDDDVDLRTEYASPNEKKPSPRETATVTENASHQQDREINIVKMCNNPQFESLQTQVDAFLKAPNIKLRSKLKEDKGEGNRHKAKTRFGKERRRFVIGSGKIQSSERAIRDVFHDDDGDDSYSLVTDSSDDERSLNGEVDEDRGKYSTSGRRLRKMHGGLIRANSAYFTPVDMPGNDKLDQNVNLVDGNSSLRQDDVHGEGIKHQATSEKVDGVSNHDSEGYPQPSEQNVEGMTSHHMVSLPTILPFTHGEAPTGPTTTDVDFPSVNNDNARVSKSKKSTAGKTISFGDIAKLQHGLKTKKLFSLVDKLASRHGIVGDVIQSNTFKEKPHAKSNNRKNFRDSFGDRNLSLATYSSVFYPMKYGYVNDGDDSQKTPNRSPNPSLKVKTERFATYLSVADSGIHSEPTQILSTRLSHIDLQEDSSDSRSADRTNTSLQPPKTNASKSSLSGPNVTGVRRSIGEGEEVDRAAMELQALQRRRDSRFQRQRRRSSMLEASHFVKSLRNKGMSKKMSFSSEVDSFGDKRRDSIMSSDDNDLSPDIHKVTWSSALSRMKLVHTLVDFTHII